MITETLVLAPVADALTDTDRADLEQLQAQALIELEADLAQEATGDKLDANDDGITPAFTGRGLMSVPAIGGIDMTALRAAVIARAVSQVGTKERPAYSNIIWAWADCKPAWQGQPWCAAAVTSWWGRAGVDLRDALDNPYYCPFLESEAKRYNAWRSNGSGYTPKAGDLILFGRGLATHVGISYPGPGNWSGYRTIEGNTSASNAGSQTNGDGCYIRYRSGSFIRGWVDMDVFIAEMVKRGELTVQKPELVAAATSKPVMPANPVPWKGYGRPISFRVYAAGVESGKPAGNVKLVQQMLAAQKPKGGKPYYVGTPNGIGDADHIAAVKAWQLAIGDTGADADGKLGPQQFGKLVSWATWKPIA